MSELQLYSDPAVHQRRWFLLGVLCLSLVMIVMAVTSLNVALPSMQRDLDTSAATLQWIVDAYAIVFAGLLLTAGCARGPLRAQRRPARRPRRVRRRIAAERRGRLGRVGDRRPRHPGRRRGVRDAGDALAHRRDLPPDERQRAIAVWVGFAGAGAAIGPIVSGALLESFWWGSAFLINLPVIALTAVAVAVYSPRSRDDEATPLDPRGAVLSIVGLAALLFAIIEGPERGWTNGWCRRRSWPPAGSSPGSSAGSGSHPIRCCR